MLAMALQWATGYAEETVSSRGVNQTSAFWRIVRLRRSAEHLQMQVMLLRERDQAAEEMSKVQ
jgi:hypothetical protein